MVNKAASIASGHKLIICGRSVSWQDGELRQLVKDGRACFAQGLDKNSNWNDCLTIRTRINTEN